MRYRDCRSIRPARRCECVQARAVRPRLVPVHPELHGALSSALAYGDISHGRIIEAHTTTAWRWVKTAEKRAEELGAIAPGKQRQHSHAAPQPRTAPADEQHTRSTICRVGWGTLRFRRRSSTWSWCRTPTGSLAAVP